MYLLCTAHFLLLDDINNVGVITGMHIKLSELGNKSCKKEVRYLSGTGKESECPPPLPPRKTWYFRKVLVITGQTTTTTNEKGKKI